MGRGGSIVNVKLKNLMDGSVIPKTFKGQEKLSELKWATKQFSICTRVVTPSTMDPESFEQFELGADVVDTAADYLKEGNELTLQFFDAKLSM